MIDVGTTARAAAADVVVRPLDLDSVHRTARRRRSRTRTAWASAAVVVAGAASALPIMLRGLDGTPGLVSSPRLADQISGVRTYTGLTRNHVMVPVAYPQEPPVGGPHWPTPQTCGVFTRPIPNVTAVHSLEHGAAWITYGPQVPDGDVAALAALANGDPHRLMSPYPALGRRIALQAWGAQLFVDSAADPRVRQFLDRYTDGAQTPEQGAPCEGSTTTVADPADLPPQPDASSTAAGEPPSQH